MPLVPYASCVRWFVPSGMASALFFGVIHFSQLYGSMPTIRLDGSGFNPYTDWIRNIHEPGLIKDILSSPITLSRKFFKVPVYALAILICSIGFSVLFYILATPSLIKKFPINDISNINFHEISTIPIKFYYKYLIKS